MSFGTRRAGLFVGMMFLALGLASESAAQTADQGVFTFNSTQSEGMPLGDGTTLVRVVQSGMEMSSDADSPLNRAATTCTGSMIMDADGVPTAASGHCDMVDIDGDVWTAWWSGGAEGGDWGFMASTGKFDGIQGSGKYWPGVAWADGRGINNWTVDYTMP